MTPTRPTAAHKLAVLGLLALAACGGGGPALTFAESTPADVRELATGVLADTAAALPAHARCLDGATLVGDRDLADRAEYEPEGARVVLRIPATAGQLTVSLVHELAHHLEFACPAQRDVRAPFLEASGLPGDTRWFEGPSWEETPSEQFAEAVVQLVVGHPDRRRPVHVSARALAVVAGWARDQGVVASAAGGGASSGWAGSTAS